MAENKLKADISGNLDLGTFNQMEDALKTISNTLDTFPYALNNIIGYAQNLAGTFSEVADSSVIDVNVFSSSENLPSFSEHSLFAVQCFYLCNNQKQHSNSECCFNI